MSESGKKELRKYLEGNVVSTRQIVVEEKVGCLCDILENVILQDYEEIDGYMFDKEEDGKGQKEKKTWR